MRLRRYAVLPVLALCPLPLALAAPASASASEGAGGRPAQEDDARPRAARVLGPLRDLQPDRDDPTDGGFGGAIAVTSAGGTFVLLGLGALDPGSAGDVHGVHVHTGPCVAGDPAAAGPHFMVGEPPSPQTEVWLDVTVQPGGWATSAALTGFEVPAGAARSIVVHARPTDPATGDAGDRLACLPLDDW